MLWRVSRPAQIASSSPSKACRDTRISAGCAFARLQCTADLLPSDPAQAVADPSAAEAFGKIKQRVDVPLVADIHFDYKIALRVAELGVDCLRINPGNIGSSERVAEVVRAAKANGPGSRQLYDPSLEVEAHRRFELSSNLAHALPRDELTTLIQPQIEMSSGQMTGGEVLLRWNQSGLFVPPSDFIPIAVFDNIGKNATIHAQISSEASVLSTQTMISGAIATIGVTCRMMA